MNREEDIWKDLRRWKDNMSIIMDRVLEIQSVVVPKERNFLYQDNKLMYIGKSKDINTNIHILQGEYY